MNVAKPMPCFFAVSVLAGKAFAFRVVVTQFKRAIEQAVHVHSFANCLVRGCRFTFMDEIAPAKLFGRESYCTRDLVHVTFEREDTLRRAETAKRTMRRHVRRYSTAVNAHVRTKIRTGGMNCPA